MARRKEFSLPGATKTGEGGSREFRKHVLKSIAEMAKQLGRSPSFAEFAARSGISKYTVMRDFSKWTQAVRAAGLKPEWVRNRLGADELLKDWGEAVRKKGGVPSTSSYVAHGKHACQTVAKRFGGWDALPAAFLKFAAGKSEWGDVVILLEQAMRQQNFSEAHQREGTRRRDSGIPRAVRGNLRGFSDALHPPIAGRTIYGDLVHFRGMRHEPVNEQGMVLLFGMLAEELGYSVESVQTGFPDCEAKRRVAPGAWQRVQIEFEFESKNFLRHQHPSCGCDVIVCWRHNWKECPKQIEVIELADVLRN